MWQTINLLNKSWFILGLQTNQHTTNANKIIVFDEASGLFLSMSHGKGQKNIAKSSVFGEMHSPVAPFVLGLVHIRCDARSGLHNPEQNPN